MISRSDKKEKIVIVVGARPNIMKAAPLMRELIASRHFTPVLIHTGQHYDMKMSDVFFKDLNLQKPNVCLGIASGTHAEQTGKVMIALERELVHKKPKLVMVVGDVNSTLASALTAKKLQIPLAHVEAGLRSYDKTMPEEVNRVLTDHISDYLFVTEKSGMMNLRKEGINVKKTYLVGNTMIDTLRGNLLAIKRIKVRKKFGLEMKGYAVLTLHRPANVDSKKNFRSILKALATIQKELPIIFPVHPRTLKQIKALGLKRAFQHMKNMVLIEPLGYLEFTSLVSEARMVLTDSGGLQEETTELNIPCVTMLETTERPITIKQGTNVIAGNDANKIIYKARKILSSKTRKKAVIQYWDGKAAKRIVKILENEKNINRHTNL